MKLRLIRNATLVLDYAGQRILIDPYFAPRFSLRSYTGKSLNPTVDLPLTPDEILDGVDWVIISHLHTDHFDAVAQALVPKSLGLFCQPGDEQTIRSKGFENAERIVNKTTLMDGAEQLEHVLITRVDGHHGLGEVGGMMGKVSGFVFQAKGEPTLYWAGDTVLCDEVRDVLSQFEPDVIITHSCGAVWPDSTGQRQLIVMDAMQTVAVCELAPLAQVVATHMEALDHATITRADLRAQARQADINDRRLLIPADGEQIAIG